MSILRFKIIIKPGEGKHTQIYIFIGMENLRFLKVTNVVGKCFSRNVFLFFITERKD